ncbi:MAG: hypothetical protein MUD08_09655 [Cytophagales bacterium]|jgi:hypothetical protein|nr:hypothetical protein [Cytophagales bacterium]
MGLAERRRIATIKETAAAAQAEFKGATGLDIPIAFEVESLPEDSGILDGYDYYKDYLTPMVTRIFQDIARDDLGKEAVKEKIKSIKIVNTSKDAQNVGTKSMDLNGSGELLLQYGIAYYGADIWYEDDLKSKIEAML